MMEIDISESEFEVSVLQKSHTVPVVVDFWAPWCGPCRVLGPVLERLAREAQGAWILAKVNTDENQTIARKFRIQGIPAVKAFVDGEVVAEFVGAQPEGQIRKWLEGIRPDPAAELLKKAADALREGHKEQAAALYQQLPDHPEALLFSAEEALKMGDAETARSLLGRCRSSLPSASGPRLAALELGLDAPPLSQAEADFRASPLDPQRRYNLALAMAASGKYEEGLELLLSLVREHRMWGNDLARKTMLQIFDIVGFRSPLADTWRSRLAAELYK